MAELIVIFILYVIAAAALSSESASIEFTAFVIFASIFAGSLRRYLLARKEAEHWRELQARMKGLELNQQQVLRRLHELEHPTAVAAREAKPAPPAAARAAYSAERSTANPCERAAGCSSCHVAGWTTSRNAGTNCTFIRRICFGASAEA